MRYENASRNKRQSNGKPFASCGKNALPGPDEGIPVVGAKIPLAEVRRAFESLADKYPPVLSLQQAAELAGIAPGTLKRKVSEGAFKGSVKRGKPLRFWRNTFVQEFMNNG